MSAISPFTTEALQRQVIKLKGELEEANETIRQLRQMLAPTDIDLPAWLPHLSNLERRFLCALHSGRLMSKGAMMTALYEGRDEPEIKSVDVYLYKLRKRLADTPIRIETVWGQGYRLGPEAIELLWPSQKSEAA
jgi:hypothetical protein